MGVDAIPPPGSSGLEVRAPGLVPVRGSESRRPGAPAPRPSAPESDGFELSPEAKALVAKLKARDQKVRAHEQAHMAAGGGLVRGGASYSYTTGPDGRQYATGGEVALDASPVPDDPRATIAKAERLRAAALAPAEPSPQDLAVAAAAGQMATQAAAELAKATAAQARGGSEGGTLPGAAAPRETQVPGRPAYGLASRSASAPGRALDLLA